MEPILYWVKKMVHILMVGSCIVKIDTGLCDYISDCCLNVYPTRYINRYAYCALPHLKSLSSPKDATTSTSTIKVTRLIQPLLNAGCSTTCYWFLEKSYSIDDATVAFLDISNTQGSPMQAIQCICIANLRLVWCSVDTFLYHTLQVAWETTCKIFQFTLHHLQFSEHYSDRAMAVSCGHRSL